MIIHESLYSFLAQTEAKEGYKPLKSRDNMSHSLIHHLSLI
jgi:hypothetical protein